MTDEDLRVLERVDIVRYIRRLTQLRPYLGIEELAQKIEDGDLENEARLILLAWRDAKDEGDL